MQNKKNESAGEATIGLIVGVALIIGCVYFMNNDKAGSKPNPHATNQFDAFLDSGGPAPTTVSEGVGNAWEQDRL